MGPMASQTPAESHARRPALVLGGGGAFGVVQAAYIQAAYELGFRPEVVIGTSVGALNGAWVALHPDEPQELLKVWLGLERMKLVDLAPHRLVQRLLRSRMSLCTNEIVPGLIARHLAGLRFEDTVLPLGIVATNLSQGMKRLFRAGPLDGAILASTAIPGVFAPVELDGDLFVDGGVVARSTSLPPSRWARPRSSPSTLPQQPRGSRRAQRWACFVNRSASFRPPARPRWKPASRARCPYAS